jgi:sigma-B regulation protein RsbU (phosphoserine phosphatase)
VRTVAIAHHYEQIKRGAGNPLEALTLLNAALVRHYGELEVIFAACCFDLVQLREGGTRLQVANAGVPPLLRCSGAGRVEPVSLDGPFLGLVAQAQLPTCDLQLEEGECVVAYTDGVIEAQRADSTPYGLGRAVEAFAARGEAPAEETIHHLLGSVETFLAGRPPSDDMLLLAIRSARKASAQQISSSVDREGHDRNARASNQ